MTDREKIEAVLRAEITSLLPQLMSGADVVRAWSPTVERLIRDAAERAYMLGLGDCGCDFERSPEDPRALWDGTHYFPLVLDAPKGDAK